MKIEKLNENQIRCTLTHADLAARHLKLSELAYGTEKAKSLFRDMMQQASFDFGFEADNIPLMIEAIPSSADSIVLIITKVEDPEELDTRFSRFTPSGESDPLNIEALEKLEGADEFLNLLNKVKEAAAADCFPPGSTSLFLRNTGQTAAVKNYSSQLFTVLGNGITSRILDMPVRYITHLSNPSPNPACLVEPYFLRSR